MDKVKPDAIRWMCDSCDAIVANADLLHAANPFDREQEVLGCPKCKAVDDFRRVCGFDGCENAATGGTPYRGQYVQRCWKHNPANRNFATDER